MIHRKPRNRLRTPNFIAVRVRNPSSNIFLNFPLFHLIFFFAQIPTQQEPTTFLGNSVDQIHPPSFNQLFLARKSLRILRFFHELQNLSLQSQIPLFTIPLHTPPHEPRRLVKPQKTTTTALLRRHETIRHELCMYLYRFPPLSSSSRIGNRDNGRQGTRLGPRVWRD